MQNYDEIDDVKRKCFDLLCFVKSVFEEERIWYSLACGTILGAVRHNGFIPWDTDVDIYVKLPDREKVREILSNKCENDLHFVNSDKEPKFMN